MWHDMLAAGIPYSEKAIRTVAVYLVLALLLRLAGKRDLAALNTFDLVVMLLLSNVVQNAVIGNDNSLVGGLAGAAILVVLNSGFARAAAGSERFARLFEGTATLLAEHGRYRLKTLRHEGIRRADLDAALRRQNATDVADVESLTIEPGGAIVATLRPEEQSATKQDVAALAEALRRIEQRLGPGMQQTASTGSRS